MLLLVGLGNPGSEYSETRHNAGFMAIDAIKEKTSAGKTTTKFKSEICETSINGEKCLLAKPMTFMNKSGIAVQEISSFYKIALSDIAVFYDEIDLELGRIRVKTGGGSGGHNGIKSIDSHIGPEYKRVRIGVGHPGTPEQVHSYVLSKFTKAEKKDISTVIDAIADSVELLVDGEDAKFMNKVVFFLNPQDKDKPKKDNKKEGSNGV